MSYKAIKPTAQLLPLTEISRCHPNPCHNGATCTETEDGFDCQCVMGYKGKNCQGNSQNLFKMMIKTDLYLTIRPRGRMDYESIVREAVGRMSYSNS